MKVIRKYLAALLLLTIIFLNLTGCNTSTTKAHKTEQQAFQTYLNDFFITLASSDSLSLNYTLSNPETYGISIKEPTLGDFSLEAMKKNSKLEQSFYDRLLSFQYELLSKDQQLTYQILKEDLELDLAYQDYSLYTEVLGPTTGLQAQLPILLAEYNFYDREDIDAYLGILKDTERYFNQICEFEYLKSKSGLFMSDAVAKKIIDQCRAFIDDPDKNYLIEYFNNKIIHMSNLSPLEKQTYIKQNEAAVKTYVIPAYQHLIDTLLNLSGTGTNPAGLANYKHGKEYYAYLVASNTGSSKSISEIATMLDIALSDSLSTMSSLIKSDPSIMEKLNSYHYCKTEPTEILNYLSKSILNDFPEPPDVSCNIKYVHKSLQDYVSPAMYLVPPLDNYKNNCIYINTNPHYDLSEIFTTIAHEGYPGHLYQCVYFHSKNNHPIRNLINYLGYEEGWATYAELYSYDYAGLDPNVASILKSNMVATHCIYSRTDIGIHYENWTYEDVKRYLTQFVSESSCETIYKTLLEEPGIYLPYCVGYLEIMELKSTAKQMLGDKYTDKAFHTFLLNIGPCNFKLIHSYMEDWIETIH